MIFEIDRGKVDVDLEDVSLYIYKNKQGKPQADVIVPITVEGNSKTARVQLVDAEDKDLFGPSTARDEDAIKAAGIQQLGGQAK